MELNIFGGARVPNNYSFSSDLKSLLTYIISLNSFDRKIDDSKHSKIYYLNNFYSIENDTLFNLEFQSAKYDHVREVIDTETMIHRGTLKRREDGDLEKTHMSIYFDEEDTALCLLEDNFWGIQIGKISNYLNEMLGKYYESLGSKKFHRIEFAIIPSEEFLVELRKMNKISLAKFTVDTEELHASDFADLSGRADIRKEVELVVKPARGQSMTKRMIEEYYDKKNQNERIKRITIKGETTEGKVVLDTEKMKTRHNIRVETEASTDVVISQSIFDEFKNILLGVD